MLVTLWAYHKGISECDLQGNRHVPFKKDCVLPCQGL